MTVQNTFISEQGQPITKHQQFLSGIHQFFERNTVDETTNMLWRISIEIFGHKDADNWENTERSDMLCFLRDLDNLIKANLKIFQLEKDMGPDDYEV